LRIGPYGGNREWGLRDVEMVYVRCVESVVYVIVRWVSGEWLALVTLKCVVGKFATEGTEGGRLRKMRWTPRLGRSVLFISEIRCDYSVCTEAVTRM
jgi:hypothetical protein